MLIRSKNILDQSALSTFLATSVNAGGTSLYVQNIAGFTLSQAIQVGKTNTEKAEVLVLDSSSPSGTTLNTTGTIKFDHAGDIPVYQIKFNQVVFKRSTSGTAGTATAMTNGTVTITPDQEFTEFDDTTATSSYAYKVAYKNSVTGEVSADSDWITPAGFSFYSLAAMRRRIRSKLYNANFIPTDDIVNDWINEYMEIMNGAIIDVNKSYALGTTDVAFSGTAELGTITATDFKEIRRVWFTSDGNTFYNAKQMDINEYDPQAVFSAIDPFYYYQGDTVIGRKPADASGTARIVYYKLNPVLSNDTDELPVPMRAYTKGFVDYGVAQALYKDNKSQEAARREEIAYAVIAKFVSQVAPRDFDGPRTMRHEYPIEGEY